MRPDLVSCPQCGLAAEVTRREALPSTHGPVEHVYVRCVQRHWFLLPADAVADVPADPPAGRPRPARRTGVTGSR